MTDIPNLTMAPGCFGLAMTYRDDARECTACPFARACAPRAGRNLAILREELGIAEKNIAPTVIDKLLQQIASAFFPNSTPPSKQCLDYVSRAIKPALMRGENPFQTGHKQPFLRIACHLLLKGTVQRDFLIMCFMDKLGQTYSVAATHAKMAVQLLSAVGAVEEKQRVMQLKGTN